MVNGDSLDISLAQFKKMRSIDRDELIYQNLVHIRMKIGDYQFHKKIQYTWLLCLTAFVGMKQFLFGG